MYACRNCDYKEIAQNYCVYFNKITHAFNNSLCMGLNNTSEKKMQKVLKTVNQAANAKLGFLKNYKRNSFTNMKQILFRTRAVSVLPYRNPYQMEIFQSVGLKVISVATSNINEFKEGRTW